MIVNVYTINAFAKTTNGGNPAGVVLNADGLSEEKMKKIAKIIGFSETAFIMESDKADFKLRFFTPNEEVDFCGHATIAAFSVLLNTNNIKSGSYTQETKAGILRVDVMENSTIMMNQSKAEFFEILDYEEVADSLNIRIDDFNTILPCQIVTTGLRDIIIPIRNRDILDSIKPNFDKVADISRKYDVIGYHMFVLDAIEGTAYCRNLAPLYEIDEESATGTSSGALASYLYNYGIIDDNSVNSISFEQGYVMNMPSEISGILKIIDGSISEVKIGGRALNMECKVIEV